MFHLASAGPPKRQSNNMTFHTNTVGSNKTSAVTASKRRARGMHAMMHAGSAIVAQKRSPSVRETLTTIHTSATHSARRMSHTRVSVRPSDAKSSSAAANPPKHSAVRLSVINAPNGNEMSDPVGRGNGTITTAAIANGAVSSAKTQETTPNASDFSCRASTTQPTAIVAHASACTADGRN